VDSPSQRDPLFERYRRAWTAYLAVQAERIEAGHANGPTPYKRAALDCSDPTLQSAAMDLAMARDAYLSDARN
jgi:hypothetical protein